MKGRGPDEDLKQHVVDAVMASVAGRHFGSTGTSLAQTVMALLMTNAVFGLVSLVLAILIIYGKSIIPASDLVAGISPWLLLIWAAWLTMTVVYRAYDVSQALSAMFGVGASALKGFVIFGTMSLLEFVSKLTR